jgi:hypothetical protein
LIEAAFPKRSFRVAYDAKLQDAPDGRNNKSLDHTIGEPIALRPHSVMNARDADCGLCSTLFRPLSLCRGFG